MGKLSLDPSVNASYQAPGGETKSLGATGPVTVEAWIKPEGKAKSDLHILGVGMSRYVMTHYADMLYWYVLLDRPDDGLSLISDQPGPGGAVQPISDLYNYIRRL